MEKRDDRLHKLVHTAFFIALGVLFPMIFHMIGATASGTVFLPMHIPVLMAGLMLGPWYGAACGVLTPIISCFATGMPPIAILPFMTFELLCYAIFAGIFYKKMNLNIYVSLILSMICGRLAKALCLLIIAQFVAKGIPPALGVWTATLSGIPGLIIQLVFIPAAILLLKRIGHRYA